jgi:hypothetical protein
MRLIFTPHYQGNAVWDDRDLAAGLRVVAFD